MGIYDREYYRKDGPSLLGSLAGQGRVTNWLIGINIVCFLLQFMTQTPDFARGVGWRDPVTYWFVLDVQRVLHGEVWRLLTYAFLHDTANIFHILLNLLVLFIFGRQVEDAIGGREYLWFYLAGAVAGGAAFVLATLLGFHGGGNGAWYQRESWALGASGAVMAVLVLAAMHNPRQVIRLFFILPIPIWIFILLLIAIDAFGLLGQGRGGVATSAHLGGAAFGYAYYKLQWRLSGWLPSFSGQGRRVRSRLRLYREDEPPTPPTPRPAPVASPRMMEDEQLEAQVDRLLEKINRVGMEGLTDQERQVLFRASEMMKRRRS